MRYLAILLLLAGCGSIERVDACGKADSWGSHHGRALAGPRVTWENGVTASILGGYQTALYWPGEPHRSAQAPGSGFQAQVEVSVPVFGGP